MGRVTTYSPKKVTCALGNHIVTGYADDSFITVENAGDGTTHVIGADGEIGRSLDPGADVFTLKLSVLQNSQSNQWLRTMYGRDKEYGDGLFSVNIADVMGGQKFTGSKAWITKHAPFNRGKAQQNVEWEIVVADGDLKE